MHQTVGRRAAPRWAMAAPYTAVRVRIGDDRRFDRTGHAYDLSASGVMFELDQPIAPGERIEIELRLPGRCARPGRSEQAESPAASGTTRARVIRVGARVVRLLDADEPGPARMAAMFFQFRGIYLTAPTSQRAVNGCRHVRNGSAPDGGEDHL